MLSIGTLVSWANRFLKREPELRPRRLRRAIAPVSIVDARVLPSTVTFSQSSYTMSIAENTANGTGVGDVSATSSDSTATVSYSIVGSNIPFQIDAATGHLTVAGALDYESIHHYSVQVQASDGSATATAWAEIDITNVNETPTITDFSGSTNGYNLWTFSGTVSDDNPGSCVIYFGGILNGQQVAVGYDGHFEYSLRLSGTGLVTAQATDGGGLTSNTANYYVF